MQQRARVSPPSEGSVQEKEMGRREQEEKEEAHAVFLTLLRKEKL